GMRVSELCGLCWRDLQANSDGGQVTVLGKGAVTRAVKIPASVWKLVSGLRGANAEPGDPVFCSRKKGNGGVLRPLAVLRVVRQAAARAGIELPVSPHWFRHAHASHALDRGAPIHLVQTTLGHASITTTGRYLHARPQRQLQPLLAAVRSAARISCRSWVFLTKTAAGQFSPRK